MDDGSRDPAFEALWGRVVEAWDDDRTHAAVLEYAIRARTLPDLAGRYRTLSTDPDRGDRARKRLDAIVVAATHLLEASKTTPPGRVPLPITLTAFALCAILLAWLAWAVWGSH